MKKMILLLILFSHGILCSEAPDPYRFVKDLPVQDLPFNDNYFWDDNDWRPSERPIREQMIQQFAGASSFNTNRFKDAFLITSPKLKTEEAVIAVHVGAYNDSIDTRIVLYALPRRSIIYAVNPWRRSADYELFLSDIKHAKCADRVIPVKMEFAEAASALNILADRIYLDVTDETIDVAANILQWYPCLKKDGIIFGEFPLHIEKEHFLELLRTCINQLEVEEAGYQKYHALERSGYQNGTFWYLIAK